MGLRLLRGVEANRFNIQSLSDQVELNTGAFGNRLQTFVSFRNWPPNIHFLKSLFKIFASS